jgi:hypothetical protein
VKCATLCRLQQVVVRNAAPQKERQPGRQLEIVDLERVSRPYALRVPFSTKHEPWVGQDRVQRPLDAGGEAALRLPGAVEREQRLDIGIVDGLPIGPSRKCLEDLARAYELGSRVSLRCGRAGAIRS